MNSLRQILLVFALLFAQLAAGVHAVGHLADRESGLPGHVCELCLAAHDLGTVLPALAALPPVVLARFFAELPPAAGRSDWPAPLARQRGPPTT